MKNRKDSFSENGCCWIKKTLLITKITTFLIIVNLLTVSATTFSQSETVTLNLSGATAKEVFAAIEGQTTYKFLYRDMDINNISIDLNVSESPVENVLDKTLENSNTTYRVLDNGLIVIAAKNKLYQQPVITGQVIDALTKEPLIGVSVLLEGTTTGVVTDIDGNYTISVPDLSQATLVFSFIGYVTEKVLVGNQTKIDIALVADIQKLDEVVVVGYGTQKKVNLTGSVGSVQMDDMEDRPLTNTGLALQGTISGVYALQKSGQPGDDGTNIDIRGVGTFDDNSPLVLIDGLPASISDVNPNDIESISVLKDAASSSIYGNRAANGVILITTKRGKSGKMKVSYSGYFGTQNATSLPEVLNSVDYATLKNEADANTGKALTYTDEDIQKFEAGNDPLYPDNNYFDIYYGSAMMQNHRLNVSGGNENVLFAFMMGHLDQDGILVGTSYKKTDFRANIDSYFLKNKRLRFSTKVAGNLGKKSEPTDLWHTKWYATLAPVIPLTNADGQWMANNGERNYYGEIKEGSTRKENRYNLSGQIDAEFEIIKGLSAQVTYGYSVVDYNKNAFLANVTLWNPDGSNKDLTSELTVTDGRDIQTMLTSLLKYNETFGMHEISILAGYSEEEFTYDWQNGYRSNFVNNTQREINLGDPLTQKNDANSYDLGLRSYFGRVNYIFDKKYLLEANIRRDGSSRFANGLKWGTFPSFSVGWIISKEAFMQDLEWLNLLKMRASWGQLGNEKIGSSELVQLYYNDYDLLSSGKNYSLGGSLYNGVAVTDLINKELTWETAEQYNIGVDLLLINGIEITADYFDKRTKDLLLKQLIPKTLALGDPYANTGEVQNKGIEASVTYKKTFANGLKLRTTVNASHIVNKITKMDPEDIRSPKAKMVGYAINSFYGYEMDGIYQLDDFTWEDVNGERVYTLKPGVVSIAAYDAQPGDIKYKDLSDDNVININDDRKVIGNQFPDLTYSLNINLGWKQFDFGMFFQGVHGIEGYTFYEIAVPFSGFANLGSWWLDRWTPDNPSNEFPRLTTDGVRNNVHSSFYMEDASYFRLKNIELGYTVSPDVVSKIGISSVRIYGNIQNAFTITNYKGFDPEQTTDETRAQAFPQVRIMSMGVNVNF